MLKAASHRSFAVDTAIASGLDCCAVCEFFDGYLCRGEASPLYKRNVDPMAKCAEYQRQEVVLKVVEEVVEEDEDLDISTHF